jgi:hypothetical protein
MVMCHGEFYFGQIFLVLLEFPVPEWAKFSKDLGNFMLFILLNALCRPLACNYCSMPMILRFGFLMGSLTA